MEYIWDARSAGGRRMEYFRFYKGQVRTKQGNYSIDDILGFDDAALESVHTYVQWAFPNAALSRAQPGAASAVFTETAATAMMQDGEVRRKVDAMTRKMLKFWGIVWEFNTEGYAFIEDEGRFRSKLRDGDHNTLRLTRLLSFLRMVGRDELVDGLRCVLLLNCPESHRSLRIWLAV